MKKEIFFLEVETFIKENSDSNINHIDPKENILASGIIDSFMLLNVILKIEELIMEDVDIDKLKLENICTLESMYSYFVNKNK